MEQHSDLPRGLPPPNTDRAGPPPLLRQLGLALSQPRTALLPRRPALQPQHLGRLLHQRHHQRQRPPRPAGIRRGKVLPRHPPGEQHVRQRRRTESLRARRRRTRRRGGCGEPVRRGQRGHGDCGGNKRREDCRPEGRRAGLGDCGARGAAGCQWAAVGRYIHDMRRC